MSEALDRLSVVCNQLTPPPASSSSLSIADASGKCPCAGSKSCRKGCCGACPCAGKKGCKKGCCNKKKACVRVCVTGAAGQIAYALIVQICSGRMFGDDVPVCLHLLDIPPMAAALVGVEMELRDCAFPLLEELVSTVEPAVAFNQVDAAVLVGAFPRKEGMLRKDLLEKNAAIFRDQGRVIDRFAKKSVKVLVVGNPANTNALICMENAPSIPRENFSALTRLDLNRAIGQIARRLNTGTSNVRNIIIWGNHSKTQFPDVAHAVVDNYPSSGITSPVASAVNDRDWLKGSFIPTVQNRGAAIIAARKLSSAASAANAIVDHMHDWWVGSKRGRIVSMGVVSDGSYGVPAGLIYSFPVTCCHGKWKIVPGLRIDAFARARMDASAEELVQERDTAFEFLGKSA